MSISRAKGLTMPLFKITSPYLSVPSDGVLDRTAVDSMKVNRHNGGWRELQQLYCSPDVIRSTGDG